jgi:hypothetical protein
MYIYAWFEKSCIIGFACAELYVTVEGIKYAVFMIILYSIFNILFSQLMH